MTPSQTRNAIRTRLAQGQRPSQIAQDLGVARSTVHRIKAKAPPRKADRAGYLSVGARVTEKEVIALDRLTNVEIGLTRSGVLRRLIRSLGRFPVVSAEEELALRAFDQDLARLGGNFNQIAKSLSASQKKTGDANPYLDQRVAILQAEHSVQELRALMAQIVDNIQLRNEEIAERLRGGAGALEADDA